MEPVPGATSSDRARAPARIADVAARAGVGVATVSRVLNGRGGVRRPRASGSWRRSRRSTTGRARSPAAFPSSGRWWWLRSCRGSRTPPPSQRVRGIVDGLSGSRYDLMVFDIESEDRQRRAFELFDRGDRADGLLVVSTLPPEPRSPACARGRHPVRPDRRGASAVPEHRRGRRRGRGDRDAPPRRARPPARRPRSATRRPSSASTGAATGPAATSARSPRRGSRPRGSTSARERACRTSLARSPRSSSPCPSGRPPSSPPPTRRRSACSRPPARSGSRVPESSPWSASTTSRSPPTSA